MSVPLDRLYNFLDSVVNQDLIIYRWTPHGSRKLKDLQPLCDYNNDFKLYTTPMVIFHDQEPLQFDRYDFDTLLDTYKYYQATSHLKLNFDTADQDLTQLIKDMHIRGVGTTAFANIYDKTILVHSELGGKDLELYQQHNYLPVYYWSHAIIARDWFRYAQHDPELLPRQPVKDFLIYNRAWSGTREYRLRFAELLIDHDLSPHCRSSFNAWCDNRHYLQHEFSNTNLSISRQDLEHWFPTGQAQSWYSADYNAEDYQLTQVEIVLETLCDDSRLHLTEKTLRPIACGHPFLLMATPGSLQYLRNYGFKTFNDIWDEDYDNITDTYQRMTAVVALMKHIQPRLQDIRFQQRMQEICEHNRARFFSAEFMDTVVKEYLSNMTMALHKMPKYRSGQYLNRMTQYLDQRGHSVHPEFMSRDLWQKLCQCLDQEFVIHPSHQRGDFV